MKVSVIIPNYNHAAYLSKRIETVLNQSYQNFEIIILDDLSADASQEIISKYRSHVKVSHVVMNDVNSGSTFKQWAKGLALASGELIWIAESDDYSSPLFLERVVAAHRLNPTTGIVYTNSYVVNENEDVLYKEYYDLAPDRYKDDFFNGGLQECCEHMTESNAICNASSAVFKKKFLDTIDFTGINMRMCGDWLVYVSVLKQSDVYYISDRLNFYRTHTNNVRSKTNFYWLLYETLGVLEYMIQERITTAQKAKSRLNHVRYESQQKLYENLKSKSIKKMFSLKHYGRLQRKICFLNKKIEQCFELQQTVK